MVCPYCSNDIEPIELNGKIFCSNCGMAIKQMTETPKPEIKQISPGQDTTAESPQEKQQGNEGEEKTTLATSANPSDLYNNDNNETQEINEPLNGDEKQEVRTTEGPLGVTPVEAFDTDMTVPQPVEAADESSPIPSTDDSVRTLTLDELKPKNDDFTDKVKEIDTLATSGILLDILDDKAIETKREKDIEALDAAKNIVEDVKFSSSDTDAKTEETSDKSIFQPSNGIKIKATNHDAKITKDISETTISGEILEQSELPSIPEIVAKADEPQNIKESEELVQEEAESIDDVDNGLGAMTDTEILSSKAVEDIKAIDDSSEEIVAEIVSEEQVTQDDLTKKVSEVFSNEPLSDEDFKDILPKKKRKPKISKKMKEEIEDAIEEIKEEEDNAVIEEKLDVITDQTETENNDETEKAPKHSPHLKNYFNHIISSGHPSKNTKKKNRKLLIKWLALLILLLIVLAGCFGLYTYFFQKKTPARESGAIQTIQSYENLKVPEKVPLGYKSEPINYNPEEDKYEITYRFINDSSRRLIYTQAKLNETTNIESIISNFQSEYNTISEDGREYTVFKDGSVVWEDEVFVYAIKVHGETYKDLVMDMANSIGSENE